MRNYCNITRPTIGDLLMACSLTYSPEELSSIQGIVLHSKENLEGLDNLWDMMDYIEGQEGMTYQELRF